MDVDGAGDVVEAGAHLDRQGELARQFGDMRANRMDAEDDMIILARGDADETTIETRFHRQVTPGGSQREFAGDDLLAFGLGLVRRQANAHDFRLGEANGRDGNRVMDAAMTGNDLGDHLALGRRLVRQQRLADDIANGEDTAHAGAALVVDLDELAIQIETHVFQAPAVQAGLAADRNEDLVGLDGLRLALGVVIFQDRLAVRLGDTLGLAGQVHIDLVLLQPHGDRTGDLLVIERQDAPGGLDEGDVRAQLAEGDTQFQADIAGANHDQFFRTFGEVERIGGADHVFAEGQEGQLDLD